MTPLTPDNLPLPYDLQTDSNIREIARLQQREAEAKFIIREVLSMLPTKRDWLNPDTEKLMKEFIAGATVSTQDHPVQPHEMVRTIDEEQLKRLWENGRKAWAGVKTEDVSDVSTHPALETLWKCGLLPSHYDTLEKAAEGVSRLLATLRHELSDPSPDLQEAVLKKLGIDKAFRDWDGKSEIVSTHPDTEEWMKQLRECALSSFGMLPASAEHLRFEDYRCFYEQGMCPEDAFREDLHNA
jgi:hypothetical protein